MRIKKGRQINKTITIAINQETFLMWVDLTHLVSS